MKKKINKRKGSNIWQRSWW